MISSRHFIRIKSHFFSWLWCCYTHTTEDQILFKVKHNQMLFAETWCPVASLGVRNQKPKHGRWQGPHSRWFLGMEKTTWKHTLGLGMYCITVANKLRNVKTSFWFEAQEFGNCCSSDGSHWKGFQTLGFAGHVWWSVPPKQILQEGLLKEGSLGYHQMWTSQENMSWSVP